MTETSKGHSKKAIIFNVLVLLSIGGIAIMNFSVSYALYYWLGMAVVFGIASVVLAWHQDTTKESRGNQAKRQVLHWASLVVSLLLVFLMMSAEKLTPETSGLIALLLLSLATVLAGVHFEWRLAILGLALMLTFVVFMFTVKYFWIVVILMVVVMLLVPQIKKMRQQP